MSVGRCRCNQNTGKLTTNANSVSVVTHIVSVGPRERLQPSIIQIWETLLSVSVGPHKRWSWWSCEYIHPKPPNFGRPRLGFFARDLTCDTNGFRSNKSYLINSKNHPCLICPFRRSGEHIHPKPPNFGGSRVGLDALDLTYDTNRLLKFRQSKFVRIVDVCTARKIRQ